jgi:hypothetical protein
MRDRVFFPLAALIALAMIAAALVWPRGMGAAEPSPAHPFTVTPTPAAPVPASAAKPARPARPATDAASADGAAPQ